MEVGVRVNAENPLTGERHLATSALITFVALNPDGSRAQVPPLTLTTADERAAFEAAHARRKERLSRKTSVVEWQKLFEPPSG
jgi:acyl-CoA hydrolase